jgi:hypothetical protein
MAFHNNPRIVTDGLVLCLDAADSSSYPGSGTTWYDLSGNGNNHNINGSPTFSNGAFTINETQTFTRSSMPTINITCTVVVVYKTTDGTELWVRGNTGSYYIAASSGNNYYHQNSGSPTYYVDTLQTTNPTTPIQYRNGNYHMFEAKNVNFSLWNQLNWWGYGSSWNMNGTVARIMIYDRSLTASESQQNFNAHRSRFNL